MTDQRPQPAEDRGPEDATPDHRVGVGPHAGPWPDEELYDQHLLAHGDRRNVADRYRYWTLEAIVADLDTRRHEFAVAIENWQHDAFFRLFGPVGKSPASQVQSSVAARSRSAAFGRHVGLSARHRDRQRQVQLPVA